jgi:hypothetical protein
MYTTAEDTVESWTWLVNTVEDYKAIHLQQMHKVDSTLSCFNTVDHASYSEMNLIDLLIFFWRDCKNQYQVSLPLQDPGLPTEQHCNSISNNSSIGNLMRQSKLVI